MIKEKAKDHSVYQRTLTHNHLIARGHLSQPVSNPMKVLIGLGIALGLAIIIIGLTLEA